MADFTMDAVPSYPVASTVQVYPEQAIVNGSGPTSAPVASAVVSATGVLTFSGLAENLSYVAAQLQSGRWVLKHFKVSTPKPTLDETSASLAAVAGDVGGLAVIASPTRYLPLTLDPSGVLDSTAALQAFFNAAAAHGYGAIPPGTYKYSALTIPSTEGNEGGCIIDGTSRFRTTLVCTAATGYGITFGDGTGFTTVAQELRNVTLAGNANCAGAVRFNGTRECAIRKAYIHGFSNAAAVGVLIDTADHNYFNEIEGCWFEDNRAHLKLKGDGSIGANSNYIFHNHFETPSAGGSYAVIVDGCSTNRIFQNEFGSAMAVGVRFENTAAGIYNEVADNQFDGPTKAWEIAGSNIADTRFVWNTGWTAVNASTDLGLRTVRRDSQTENARVSVYNAAGSGDVTISGLQTMTWGVEAYDPLGMHDNTTNTDRLTVYIPGVYRITAQINFAADAVGVRMVRLTKNGTATILAEHADMAVTEATEYTTMQVSIEEALVAGDYILCRCYETSASTVVARGGLSPGCRFQMIRVGD